MVDLDIHCVTVIQYIVSSIELNNNLTKMLKWECRSLLWQENGLSTFIMVVCYGVYLSLSSTYRI